MKKLLGLESSKAKEYFMKDENYCSIDLPTYFTFSKVLEQADLTINKRGFDNCLVNKLALKNTENANYKLYSNKDGNYAWRPFEIIHPFLYVNLVNKITEMDNWQYIKNKFKEFKKNKKIICCSDIQINLKNKKQTATNINSWWKSFEQKSISMFLEYSMMSITDITGCYESIYTHSIAWALHGKEYAKEHRNDKTLIGNVIDTCIQQMRYGQTNGIPQGSSLMDFIAEIVLGYSDNLLSEKLEKLKIKDYVILRYRDDYRIFTNSEELLNIILKELSSVLSELNLKMNGNKTFLSHDIIIDSIKPDKLQWICVKNNFEQEKNLQKKLFILKNFSDQYTNSGQLKTALTELLKEDFVVYKKEISDNYETICAILCSIWLKNPSTYAHLATMFSKIFEIIYSPIKLKKLMHKLLKKFENSPNNTYFEVWIQRALIKFIDISKEQTFQSKLARMVYSPITLWDSSWLKSKLFKEDIIDSTKLKELGKVITFEEFCLFNDYDGGF